MKDVLVLIVLYAVAFALMILGVGLVLKDFKNSMRVLIVTAFVVIISPTITYAILVISRVLKKYQLVEAIGSADAWIGFAGSIIGGSITMLALYLTFRHERAVGRQQYIESIKPYITCRISNYDEFERSIDVGNCLNDYGFIQWKMKNISPNIANIRYIDQYVSIEHAKGEYVKQENLEQFGISIYTVQLDDGFFLAPKDSYRWKTNILIEQDDEGNYKFEGSAFAFRYTIQFGVIDVLKADTYVFEFSYCSGRAKITTLRSERNDQFCQKEIANSPVGEFLV